MKYTFNLIYGTRTYFNFQNNIRVYETGWKDHCLPVCVCVVLCACIHTYIHTYMYCAN